MKDWEKLLEQRRAVGQNSADKVVVGESTSTPEKAARVHRIWENMQRSKEVYSRLHSESQSLLISIGAEQLIQDINETEWQGHGKIEPINGEAWELLDNNYHYHYFSGLKVGVSYGLRSRYIAITGVSPDYASDLTPRIFEDQDRFENRQPKISAFFVFEVEGQNDFDLGELPKGKKSESKIIRGLMTEETIDRELYEKLKYSAANIRFNFAVRNGLPVIIKLKGESGQIREEAMYQLALLLEKRRKRLRNVDETILRSASEGANVEQAYRVAAERMSSTRRRRFSGYFVYEGEDLEQEYIDALSIFHGIDRTRAYELIEQGVSDSLQYFDCSYSEETSYSGPVPSTPESAMPQQFQRGYGTSGYVPPIGPKGSIGS